MDIENYMLLPRQRFKTQKELDEEYEAELEEQDRDYEDSIFDEMVGD